MIPSREECFRLLREFRVPENVMRHTLQVNRIALYIGRKLLENGIKVDLELVDRASLLHDIDKILTLGKKPGHGDVAESLLKERGFPEIGEIIRKHRLFMILNNELRTWEEKLVYYADKRVLGDRIVSLDERMNYLRRRYGITKKRLKTINDAEPLLKKLEREIFSKAKVPVDLRELATKHK